MDLMAKDPTQEAVGAPVQSLADLRDRAEEEARRSGAASGGGGALARNQRAGAVSRAKHDLESGASGPQACSSLPLWDLEPIRLRPILDHDQSSACVSSAPTHPEQPVLPVFD